MNRSITYLGLAILLAAIGLLVFPVATGGVEQLDTEVEVGIFVLPVGLSAILWGAASPDPSITTVGGIFGNPDENVLRRFERRAPRIGKARFLPNPRESVNCRQCYTAIPAVTVACPRCGRNRDCRECGARLALVLGAARCAQCGKVEVYCSCPRPKKPAAGVLSARPHIR